MQHKMEDLDREVESMLRRGPVTPDEVSTHLGVSWSTANAALLRLSSKGLATVSRKGRVNVYFLGPLVAQSKHLPSWAKAKSLDRLASELTGFFPPSETSAEIIRRERAR